ncbi:hypothetical protein G6L63_04355 [Agrobacterium vitis]|uniref:hypothetical protein n=1 Tax=Agrobacterium vitis TaxID=373 RepID=UPI000AA2BD36|nr:hypothetical protein [Agrobacterium vitis]MCF1475927.1 hypothetical protein [Agrobacterium vitis]MUZ97015.1 hypothetical protein [Agrobacterium vitis]MVA29189.1 hypothetical protein [Agrobacterium vitis]NOJ34976.1 hypothetical protein [Agrobacterium vitis]NSZ47145.1 hypothetical protein [Agrobacterium vitis]
MVENDNGLFSQAGETFSVGAPGSGFCKPALSKYKLEQQDDDDQTDQKNGPDRATNEFQHFSTPSIVSNR